MAVSVQLMPGDCLTVIPELVARGVVVDSVCCDPPYEIAFMSRDWDRTGVAFRPETWATIGSIMRPGAFLAAFGGCRTYHRMTCAIEDAGFVVQDCVMFLFGTGFPKNKSLLKPAYEPICLAYKPGGKRTLQVDECRIAAADGDAPMRWETPRGGFWATDADTRAALTPQDKGRWPANVCHDGSEEVIEAFAAFGESKSVSGGHRGATQIWGQAHGQQERGGFDDAGSAARFFYSSKANAQDRWGSRHPTVKPVELMKWLVPLVTPLCVDGRPGLCLDPFAGSGTTGVAALATGRDCILIEREDQYIADIKERLAFYEGGGTHSVQAKNRSRVIVDDGPLFGPTEDVEARNRRLRGGRVLRP